VGYSACGCLVRYIHLNPLRAELVANLSSLERYPWCGHSAILGNVARPWQATEEILGQFGSRLGAARRQYRQFVAEGVARGRRPELQGGGLRRSAGGWEGVAVLRRGRERWASDERILGSGPFVDSVRQEAAQAAPPSPWPHAKAAAAMGLLVDRMAAMWGTTPAKLVGRSRQEPAPSARAAICTLAITHLGIPAPAAAKILGFSPAAALIAARRGQALLAARGVDPEQVLRSLKAETI